MPCNTPPPPEFQESANAMEVLDEDIMYFEGDEDYDDDNDLVVDDSVLTFSGHSAPVLCCDLSKNKEFAISGGQDDKAFVWNTTTAEILFECIGHSESVVAAQFSPDDKYLATADMNGAIAVWDVEAKGKLYQLDVAEVTWLQWHSKENFFVTGGIDGDCFKCSAPTSNISALASYGSGSTCGSILPDGERCAVCYTDGSVRIWNINHPTSVITSLTGSNAFKKSITCANCHPNNSLIVAGDEDSNAKLIRSENCKVLWNLNCCIANSSHGASAVESVDFFNSHPFMVTGTSCGCLAIWDVASQVQRFSCDMESSVVKLMCNDSSWVFVGTSEGDIHLLDARTGAKERKYVGHTDGILNFTLSREGDWILSASDDHTCKIFHVN